MTVEEGQRASPAAPLLRAVGMSAALQAIFSLQKFEKIRSLPSIVVVGDTSVGKSTLLSKLTGVALPEGKEVTTRCPLVLTMINCEASSALNNRIHDRPGYKLWLGDEEPSNWESLKDLSTLKNKIGNKIWEMQDTARARSGELFPSIKINLTVKHPEVPNISVVDLPGRITNERDEHRGAKAMIDAMIDKLIQFPAIIVAVEAVSDHVLPENLHTMSYIRQKHPGNYRERTVLALTKADAVTNKETLLVLVENLEKFGVDYVVPVTLDDSYFKADVLRHIKDKCGYAALADILSERQEHAILSGRKDIIEQLDAQIREHEVKVRRWNDRDITAESVRSIYTEITTTFLRCFDRLVCQGVAPNMLVDIAGRRKDAVEEPKDFEKVAKELKTYHEFNPPSSPGSDADKYDKYDKSLRCASIGSNASFMEKAGSLVMVMPIPSRAGAKVHEIDQDDLEKLYDLYWDNTFRIETAALHKTLAVNVDPEGRLSNAEGFFVKAQLDKLGKLYGVSPIEHALNATYMEHVHKGLEAPCIEYIQKVAITTKFVLDVLLNVIYDDFEKLRAIVTEKISSALQAVQLESHRRVRETIVSLQQLENITPDETFKNKMDLLAREMIKRKYYSPYYSYPSEVPLEWRALLMQGRQERIKSSMPACFLPPEIKEVLNFGKMVEQDAVQLQITLYEVSKLVVQRLHGTISSEARTHFKQQLYAELSSKVSRVSDEKDLFAIMSDEKKEKVEQQLRAIFDLKKAKKTLEELV